MRYAIHAAFLITTMSTTATADTPKVAPEDAWKFVGQIATVCGKVVGAKFEEGSRDPSTLLYLDKPFPMQVFTVDIPIDKRQHFGPKPEKNLIGKIFCVTGEIERDYYGAGKIENRARIFIHDLATNKCTVK